MRENLDFSRTDTASHDGTDEPESLLPLHQPFFAYNFAVFSAPIVCRKITHQKSGQLGKQFVCVCVCVCVRRRAESFFLFFYSNLLCRAKSSFDTTAVAAVKDDAAMPTFGEKNSLLRAFPVFPPLPSTARKARTPFPSRIKQQGQRKPKNNMVLLI